MRSDDIKLDNQLHKSEVDEFILVLTACILPRVYQGSSFRSNPILRLNDYKESLRKWLRHSDKRITGIVFIENSNYDLSEIKTVAKNENIHGRKIEFISFLETPRSLDIHYGYSEMEILDYFVDNSILIKQKKVFIKVTGRLFFPTISILIDLYQKNPKDFYSDCRDFNILVKKQHYIVTTLFFSNKDFYKRKLYNTKELLKDKKFEFMETAYFHILIDEQNVLLRFPINVDPIGIGAHANVNYSSNKKKIFSILRSIFRKLTPTFKI